MSTTTKRRRLSDASIIAATYGWDREEMVEYEYQPGRHIPRVWSVGEEYLCVSKDEPTVLGLEWIRHSDQTWTAGTGKTLWFSTGSAEEANDEDEPPAGKRPLLVHCTCNVCGRRLELPPMHVGKTCLIGRCEGAMEADAHTLEESARNLAAIANAVRDGYLSPQSDRFTQALEDLESWLES